MRSGSIPATGAFNTVRSASFLNGSLIQAEWKRRGKTCHRLSRKLSQAVVTSPFTCPFTWYGLFRSCLVNLKSLVSQHYLEMRGIPYDWITPQTKKEDTNSICISLALCTQGNIFHTITICRENHTLCISLHAFVWIIFLQRCYNYPNTLLKSTKEITHFSKNSSKLQILYLQ